MPESKNSRRDFFQKTAGASVGLTLGPGLLASEAAAQSGTPAAPTPEWRNRQEGMSYRPLGRTGMMVSELIMGTFPFEDPSYYPSLDAGIERGMNYVDTAAAYSKGQVESNLGDYFEQTGNREKVFLSTKLSGYYGYLDRVLREVEKDLTRAQIESLQKQAEQMMADRGVLKPGYHMNYFAGQEAQFAKTYYRHLMLQQHGYRAGWKEKIKEHARGLLEQALGRLKTDYLDVLHCPHGIAMPEMMDDEVLRELFAEFKQRGLIRAAALSFHNDVGGNLSKAVEVGYYDAAMFAYNIANHAALENVMFKAKEAGLGMIAMKVARLFAMEKQPEWRQEKLDRTLPDDSLSVFAKAYLWALQNPNLSCCVSQMETVEIVEDNYKIIGVKRKLSPA
ncbi:putative aldo-keto reductase [Planctomycetes bacterium MalM25]|nr:putative aldo-keto reductase [Planctomycetes bacterium MalM25]